MPPTVELRERAGHAELARARRLRRVRGAGSSRAPTIPPRPREFLETVIFRIHLMRLPAELRDPFLDAMMERLPTTRAVLDYVRLNFDATAI